MKKNILIILFSLSLLFITSFFPSLKPAEENSSPDSAQVDKQVIAVTIAAVGDLMCHSVQYQYAHVEGDSFDFNPVYNEVKKYLSEADFTFGNLETVTAGKQKGYSGYPFFNSPDDFIPPLKNAGFDLITTSNNHSLDQGEHGLRRTIEQLTKNHLSYNGTFISEADRDSIRIFNLKGIRVAFLSYTYGTNGIPVPKGKAYLINVIDYNLIEKDIKSARANGAEIVLVHFHFGEEYKREPVKSQREAVEKAIQFGADIIIGGHPHVVQPTNYFKTLNAKLDTGFVAYSLGNFVSNQRWRYSDAGIILNIELKKNFITDSVYISNVNYIPTWVFKGSTEKRREYLILPAESVYKKTIPAFLTKSDLSKMKQSFEDTKEIMEKYNSKIQLKGIEN